MPEPISSGGSVAVIKIYVLASVTIASIVLVNPESKDLLAMQVSSKDAFILLEIRRQVLLKDV